MDVRRPAPLEDAARSKPRLTPHQAEVYARLVRLSRGSGYVAERHIGSHGALWRLIRKGYVEVAETVGPRGGTHYHYRPVQPQS